MLHMRLMPTRPQWALLLLGGCTIGQPVQLPSQGGIFMHGGPPWPQSAEAVASEAAARKMLLANCEPAGRYAGGLGEALCDADVRRLQLLGFAAEATNTNATYNAWLWPLGSAALYEKMRGAPNSKLLLPAALAAGVFGYINAGIPDRAKRYLGGAGKLACVMVEGSAELYTSAELERPLDEGMPFTPEAAPGLDAALRTLRDEARQYNRARASLLAGLTLRSGPAKDTSTFVAQAAARHRGGSGGGGVKDSRADIRRETQARLDLALKVLDDGRAAHARIHSSGWRLRAATSEADRLLQLSLSDQVAPPESPASATAQIMAQLNLLAAQSGVVASTVPDATDAALPVTLFEGLSPDSRRGLQAFQTSFGGPLYEAIHDVNAWLKDHARRRESARQAATEIGCAAAAALPTVAVGSTNPARQSTSVTGSGTSPASGTPLPRSTN